MNTIKILSRIALGIGICLAVYSCDKIEGPYIIEDESVATTVVFPDVDTATVYRKILFEEFTGHNCSGCPDGHVELENLINTFHDTIVPIGIHALRKALPSVPPFDYDFTTEIGNAFEMDFEIPQTPCALINRVRSDNIPEWRAAVENVNRNQKVAAVQIINEFNATTKTLTAHTKTTALENYPNTVQLSLFIIEDGIIAPQNVHGVVDTFYVHKHVLRTSMNGTYGAQITPTGLLTKGEAYTKSYKMECSSKDWNFANCAVVAILFDTETKEVIQVESCPFLNEKNIRNTIRH